MEEVDEKINNLQKEVTNLIGSLSNAPKNDLPALGEGTGASGSGSPAVSPTVVQGEPSVILRCKQWADFQVLAMHAQTLFFSYKENEKVFQVDALRGNQLIIYAGALPISQRFLKNGCLSS